MRGEMKVEVLLLDLLPSGAGGTGGRKYKKVQTQPHVPRGRRMPGVNIFSVASH